MERPGKVRLGGAKRTRTSIATIKLGTRESLARVLLSGGGFGGNRINGILGYYYLSFLKCGNCGAPKNTPKLICLFRPEIVTAVTEITLRATHTGLRETSFCVPLPRRQPAE